MIDWVYSRKDLAELIIKNMKENLFDRVTIFAPRKRGKTKFVQHDVIPLALELGVLPVYVDFWYDEDNPERSFVTGVNESISAYAPTIKKMKTSKISSFEISAFWMKMKTDTPASLSDFDDCVRKLNSIDMPILLLLDEVQHLGTRPEFSKFTKTLRSFMTARADNKIKGLFTGSNQNDLKRLFEDSKAPFFESSSGVPFKALDESFVKYQLNNYKKARNGEEVNFDRAMSFFLEHHRKPEPITALLRQMAAYAITDIDYALDNLELDFSENSIKVSQLLKRKDTDFGILYLLAIGQASNLFSSETAQKLKVLGLVGNVKVTASDLNNAKARLLRDNLIINPSRGEFHLESPELADVVIATFIEKQTK
ncbi:hypothetical protein N9R79_07100 [Vibrio sp.]|nr:hypothetical protein [Vibrio sp.]